MNSFNKKCYVSSISKCVKINMSGLSVYLKGTKEVSFLYLTEYRL